MTPVATSDLVVGSAPANKKSFPEPLKLSGVLNKFTTEDTTPVIGREFVNVNIVDDLLKAPNSDELLRDVAITSKSLPNLLPVLSNNPTNHFLSLPTRRGLLPRPRQPHG